MTQGGGDNLLPSTTYKPNGEPAHGKHDFDSISQPFFCPTNVTSL
jgi:hypothetical protein